MADELSTILSDPIQRARLEKRFWAKVDRSAGPDGCWIWNACLDSSGYGLFWAGPKPMQRAHRVSWALVNGRLPDPCGLHRCDNPPCVNPAHIFEGTKKDNVIDRDTKGRGKLPAKKYGSKHQNAKLSEADVLAIRAATGTQTELARQYGVSQITISRIKSRKRWGHLP